MLIIQFLNYMLLSAQGLALQLADLPQMLARPNGIETESVMETETVIVIVFPDGETDNTLDQGDGWSPPFEIPQHGKEIKVLQMCIIYMRC